jgi:hypothetical protein
MGNLRVIIFNVEHGFCAFVKSPTARTLLIDCGKTAKFSPILNVINNEFSDVSVEGEFYFSEFILSHPHGDHIDDIERLKIFKPRLISRQKDYDWEAVKDVNSDSGAEKVEIYKDWQATYNREALEPDWGFDLYQSDFLTPGQAKQLEESKMVNNSSIPVVITFKGTQYQEKVLFSGDLEKKAWIELLRRQSFKNAIKGTDVFITSHHGHSSGYCKEIFEAMGKPIVNIVSTHTGDESVETAYSSPDNALGIEIGGIKRYMLSTRKDGSICIDVGSDGKFWISLNKYTDNLN